MQCEKMLVSRRLYKIKGTKFFFLLFFRNMICSKVSCNLIENSKCELINATLRINGNRFIIVHKMTLILNQQFCHVTLECYHHVCWLRILSCNFYSSVKITLRKICIHLIFCSGKCKILTKGALISGLKKTFTQ